MARYLNPKADVVFKRIFGEHPHLLIHFLNSLLPLSETEQIKSLEYLSAEQAPKIPEFKRSIVDVKCKDTQGRIFIVEMQMEWTTGFMQRMLFNSAHAYVKQLRRGEDYEFLCPVYGLGLINSLFDRETPDWYHHYKIVHAQSPEKQLKGLEFVFLELPKFKPSTQEGKRLRALWLRFLSEIGEGTTTIDSELLVVPEIKEACDLCEEAAYSKTELATYDSYWDFVSTAKTFESGKLAEGMAQGRAQGREEGIEIGRKTEKIDIAKQLLAHRFALSGISAVTQLSIEELQLLQEQITSEILPQ